MGRKSTNQSGISEKRILFLFSIVTLSFLLLISRVVYIQAINPDYFITKSKNELNSSFKKTIPAKRGEIEDRDGEKLAVTLFYKMICGKPKLIKNKERTAEILAEELNLNKEELLKKMAENPEYVVFAVRVPVEKAKKIHTKLKEDYIWLEEDYRRLYPYNSLAAQVIGFVGLKPEPDTKQYAGKEGLEYYYDELLSGDPGYIDAQFFSSDEAVVPNTVEEEKDAIDGKNLAITIDKDLQFFVEEELKKAVEEQEAKAGAAIVMDSKTGEIYAMASYPTFDLNQYNKVKNHDAFINRCVRAVYEPGSTFKTITVASCIEEKLVSPETKLYLPEELKIGKYRIREAHRRPAGTYSVKEIIEESMNIGAARMAEKLGGDRFYEYGLAFGFGQKTGIDLSGEQAGRFPPPEEWKKTTFANLSFGQGLSCTPLQMLIATNVFSNGGYLVKPHLMKYAYDSKTGQMQEWQGEKPVKIVSEKTAEAVKKLLIGVVEEGTGVKARLNGYTIAGKTGTAQVAGKNGYEKGRFVSSFVGFFPASNPRFSAIVVIYEPKKAHYGGVVAAPVFAKIAEHAVKLYGIPPDAQENNAEKVLRSSSIGD